MLGYHTGRAHEQAALKRAMRAAAGRWPLRLCPCSLRGDEQALMYTLDMHTKSHGGKLSWRLCQGSGGLKSTIEQRKAYQPEYAPLFRRACAPRMALPMPWGPLAWGACMWHSIG